MYDTFDHATSMNARQVEIKHTPRACQEERALALVDQRRCDAISLGAADAPLINFHQRL